MGQDNSRDKCRLGVMGWRAAQIRGIWWDERLDMTLQRALADLENYPCPGLCHWQHGNRCGGIVLLCPTQVKPHMEHCIQPWGPCHGKYSELLEQVQRKPQKCSKG